MERTKKTCGLFVCALVERAYEVNPAKPMGSWKTAWKAARKLAGRTLSGKPEEDEAEPLAVRTRDLRHTAISRMIDGGVPLRKIAKTVGWSPSTMVKMAARYGHFNTDELRGAVEAISRPEAHSPMGSPVSTEETKGEKSKLLIIWLLR